MLLICVCVCVLLSSVIRDNLLLSSKAHDLRRSLDQLRGNPTLTMRREAMTGMQASSLSGGAVGMLLSCAICKLITLPQPNLNLRDGMEWMNIKVNLWGLYLSSKKNLHGNKGYYKSTCMFFFVFYFLFYFFIIHFNILQLCLQVKFDFRLNFFNLGWFSISFVC